MNDINEEKVNTENMSEEDSLTEARELLLSTVAEKVPASARGVIDEALAPMIETLSEEDCRAMVKLIQEKGVLGALMISKKKKKKLEKSGADLTQGRVNNNGNTKN